MGKTKKVTSAGGNNSGNPFGIKSGSGGFNIGQQMLKGKAGVKSAGDKRKSVRVPIQLYNEVVARLSHGEKYPLMTEILTSFLKEFEQKGDSIIQNFNDLETRPIKISEEAFRILKVFKFETDQSNTDIIASALTWYKEKNKGKA
ncbi:TPA: hypothetical protein ACHA1K_001633 [Enterococcus faecium]|uniref:Uncharacterized protein n=3 Tax=Enterococcus TaxID=1350 RepID=A0A286Q5P0_ENTAV|nr:MULTISPECIES: hypothetical protein [Enterococcus]APB62419.1 hypothetical protein pEMA120_p08 [Enterococcus faecium]APB62574.1 hypothetical protein pEA19081_p78 [Enterococcus avium]EOF89082.1 hypothetical protein SKG_02754 [Enterococcus faecium EnGen0166]EOH43460.1 hypothetical protein SSI_02915 [Enterococcus faecium EnGen0191]EOM18385.1 hypothetical protein SSM_03025 [Enterococcus faecium EnGen0192]